MTALCVVAALLLDRGLGEPRRWHPLVGFGRLVNRLEGRLLDPAAPPAVQRRHGAVGCAVLVGLPAALLAWVWPVPGTWLATILGVVVVYLSVGGRSLAEHARAVAAPLAAGDPAAARGRVAMLVSRDTDHLDEAGVARAAVESVLENGSDAVLAPVFWFVVAGPPGALGYRLANTLDARWGYRTPRYRDFGRAAARLDDLLNWVPARLCALTYGLVAGRPAAAVRCWRSQAGACASPNAGPVMAAGAGALEVRLGGAGVYHGRREQRGELGRGRDPGFADIERAVRLLTRAVVVWVLVIAMAEAALREGFPP